MNFSSSDIEKIIEWISQFKEDDKKYARLILESLIYVSDYQLNKKLNEIISEFVSKNANETIALFVIREKCDYPYWQGDQRPNSVDGQNGVGSEGLLAKFCRDFSKLNPKQVLNHPSIPEMRECKCRHIIVIDDIIGSGSRAAKFFKWLYENRTIKSWKSFKYIDFNIFSYACTELGFQEVSKLKQFNEIKYCQQIENGRGIWSLKERENIERICQEYGHFTRSPQMCLGYKNCFSFVVFSHGSPNTNPAILWASKKSKWKAIFETRPDFVFSEEYFKKPDRSFILKLLGYFRLVDSVLFPRLKDNEKELISVLSCLRKRVYSSAVLSGKLNIPVLTIDRYLYQLEKLHWIAPDRHVTKTGKSILYTMEKKKYMNPVIDMKKEFYYPQTLRAPVDSSSDLLE